MTRWQQLGAFVATVANLSDEQIAAFADAGGRWLVPVIYGDDASGPDNLARLPDLQARCSRHGIRVGGWFNCWGGPAVEDAAPIARLARSYSLSPVVLDLEEAYKGARAPRMPELLTLLRYPDALPRTYIGVSSYGFADRAMIWRDFYRLRVRYLPQWYSPIFTRDGRYGPVVCMADLWVNGSTDPNLADSAGPFGRGLPLSFVHGTVEATGIEGADLSRELAEVSKVTRPLLRGLSLYTLENAPASDLALLKAQRGRLFLA